MHTYEFFSLFKKNTTASGSVDHLHYPMGKDRPHPEGQAGQSRWRIYTKHQVEDVIELIRKTKYFSK